MAKAQILIVEDERIVAEDIKQSLESLGYIVCAVASSGEEAIKKAEEYNPDLVLMDIVLKGEMDGIEAATKIRSHFKIPIVYLTAYADEKTLERAKLTEPFGYIIKPFDERELHTAIEIAFYKSKMENELKEREEWFFTTLNSIGDGVITTDANGLITFMNPVAEYLTGWKQEDAVGKPLLEVFRVVNEKTGKLAEDPVNRIIKKGVIAGLANHTILIAKDGRQIPIDNSGAPIKDAKGNVTGVVLVFRDITQRKKMEEEFLKATKLESIGILAGGIAHDFNNILTAVLGNISLAKMLVNPDHKVFKRLSEAEEAALQAKNLSQQLLTFSKGGAPIKKTASMAKILKGVTSFALRGSSIRCEFSIPESLWPVEVDEGQMSQVINNLIINAIQAMPKGGIIKVCAENVTIGAEGSLPLKGGKYVKITIKDQGTGIPKEHIPKVFDPFFTTKQEGNGLGLAVAYFVVKNHDGYITLESELGVGTTFYIYLPASHKELPKEETIKEEPLMGKGRVLVMDDEEMVREVLDSMLEHIGYEVEFAKDGIEAIEQYKRAKELGRPFDAVIMDLTIPGSMGGKEAIQKLLKIDPKVKAIVSSGYSHDPVMANFKKYGFKGVIAKPYKITTLSEVLHKVITGEDE